MLSILARTSEPLQICSGAAPRGGPGPDQVSAVEAYYDLAEPVRCSLCHHPLGSQLYRICYHPLTDSPLCALCAADLETAHLPPEEDMCAFCRDADDTGLLYTCSLCSLGFCGDCLSTNLTTEALAEARREDRDWECMRCNRTLTAHLTEAAKALARDTIFSADYFDGGEGAPESELEVEYQRLSLLSEELKNTELLMEESSLESVRLEISREIGLPIDHEGVLEEWETYKLRLQRHFDLIQFQECGIAERLAEEGVHVPSLPEYDLKQVQDRAKLEPVPVVPERSIPQEKRKSEEDRAEYYPHPFTDFKAPDTLASMREEVLNDSIVSRILATDKDTSCNYPSFFEQVIPRELIIAYTRSVFTLREL